VYNSLFSAYMRMSSNQKLIYASFEVVIFAFGYRIAIKSVAFEVVCVI
jgi:hypothetical protein